MFDAAVVAFNRTSMELKQHNPNNATDNLTPFNRTSMELKHRIRDECYFEGVAFNRTSMELKPVSDLLFSKSMTKAFNRTSMELKHRRASLRGNHSILLIEPVWN